MKWTSRSDGPKTVEERLKAVEADNATALEGISALEQGVSLVYRLIDAMRGNPLLSALVDKLDIDARK